MEENYIFIKYELSDISFYYYKQTLVKFVSSFLGGKWTSDSGKSDEFTEFK